MNAIRVALLILLASWSWAGHAASLDPDKTDCAQVLARWAENPSSVPQRLVDLCKEKMAAIAPAAAAPALAAAPEAADPCAGPNAANSVLCWGPWSTLAPAAGGPVAALEFPDELGDCEYGVELDARCVAQYTIPEPYPIEGCAPGTPCGFATLVSGVTSQGDVEETQFFRFDLAPDGSAFVVDPNGDNEITSVEMGVNIQPRNDGYENMRSSGTDPASESSRLISRIVRDEEGRIELAADVWAHGNRSTGVARSGFFAWGTSTSQAGLNALNGAGARVSFAGPMSVDNATNAAITVAFGSNTSWTGTWTNPAWSFGAGGAVNGVNFLSDPGQFTANVQSGSFVQGAILGEPGRQGIAHIIDVNLTDGGHIRDVGLLREVAAGPAPTFQP